jgi:hypothetical protein
VWYGISPSWRAELLVPLTIQFPFPGLLPPRLRMSVICLGPQMGTRTTKTRSSPSCIPLLEDFYRTMVICRPVSKMALVILFLDKYSALHIPIHFSTAFSLQRVGNPLSHIPSVGETPLNLYCFVGPLCESSHVPASQDDMFKRSLIYYATGMPLRSHLM